MSANDSLHLRVPDRAQHDSGADELRSGAGAASAMERMKAERAMRHKHQHGIPAADAGCEEDEATGR